MVERLLDVIEDHEKRGEIEEQIQNTLSNFDITVLTNVYYEESEDIHVLQLSYYREGELYIGEIPLTELEDENIELLSTHIEYMMRKIMEETIEDYTRMNRKI